jgi:hypothetical protein
MSQWTKQDLLAIRARERAIVTKALECLIDAGYSVREVDATPVAVSTLGEAIEMANGLKPDGSTLDIFNVYLREAGGMNRVGFVRFSYGIGTGAGVIEDYSLGIESTLKPALKLADYLTGQPLATTTPSEHPDDVEATREAAFDIAEQAIEPGESCECESEACTCKADCKSTVWTTLRSVRVGGYRQTLCWRCITSAVFYAFTNNTSLIIAPAIQKGAPR